MPESLLSQIERHLIDSRLPRAHRKRALQELSEHRDDLIRAALDDGLSETEAAIRADNSLGDPIELADQIVVAARNASWWSRHPLVSFCVIPFFGSVLAIVLAYTLVLAAFYFLAATPRSSGINCATVEAVLQTYFAQITFCEHLAQLIVIGAAALFFCKLAVESASKRHWLWIASAICSVQGYLWMMTVKPHNITVGYLLWPTKFIPVASAIIPIAIALLTELHQRRSDQQTQTSCHLRRTK